MLQGPTCCGSRGSALDAVSQIHPKDIFTSSVPQRVWRKRENAGISSAGQDKGRKVCGRTGFRHHGPRVRVVAVLNARQGHFGTDGELETTPMLPRCRPGDLYSDDVKRDEKHGRCAERRRCVQAEERISPQYRDVLCLSGW